MLLQSFRDPFLDAAFRILDVAALGGPADDAFERRAGTKVHVQAGIQQVSITRIADDQAVLAVVTDEAFGDALDCLGEVAVRCAIVPARRGERRDVVEPDRAVSHRLRRRDRLICDLNVGN